MQSDVKNSSATTSEASPAAPSTVANETMREALMGRLRRGDIGQLPAVLMLLVIVVVFEILSGGVFLHPINLSNLILQEADVAVIALAAVLTLLLAEIDLSLAAVAYLCGAVTVITSTYHHWPAVWALVAGLVAGLIVGTINGVLVAVLRIPSFVVTLAGYIFYSGLLLHLELPNTTITLFDPSLKAIMSNYVTFPWDVISPIPIIVIYGALLLLERQRRMKAGLSSGPLWAIWLKLGAVVVFLVAALLVFEDALGVPYAMYIVFGVLIVFWLLLRFTTFGRHVYAVGGNPEAARRAGINVTMIRISVFALGSMLAGLGGILVTSRTTSAPTAVDPRLLLLAIAVAVIGGVSLFGGRGSVWGVVLGVLIIGCLENGLTLFSSASSDFEQMLEGAVLIAAVILDAITRRRNAVSGR
ncbi:MAG TPA: inner-membrane translocator [Ktedonobacterales bacterium]|nr:inner-membrane translocator [Ktedonobacterales bacterium]